jgi:hypothetical protein
MRRVFTITILLSIVAITAWSLWRWRAPESAAVDPWRAVPSHAALIVELPEALKAWDDFAHTSQLYGALEQLPTMAATGRMAKRLMERREGDAELREALDRLQVVMSVSREGAEGTGTMIAAGPVPGRLLNVLAEALHVDASSTAALAEGRPITANPDSALGTLHLRSVNGLLLIASSADVLDGAVLQLERPSVVEQDNVLARAVRTLGAGAEAHVLVHTTRTHNLLHNWWTAQALEPLQPPGGWVALDLRTRPDALLLGGLLVPAGTDAWVRRVLDQGTGRLGIARVLPATVGRFDVLHVDDPARVVITDTIAEERVQALIGWAHGTVGTASEVGDSLNIGAQWAVFQTDDATLAQEALTGLCPTGGCDTLAYRGVRMTHLPLNGAYERLLGPAFASFHRPWYAVLGDVVVMSTEPDHLLRSIDAWHDGNTLAEDGRTTSWLQRVSATFGRMSWGDVGRARSFATNGLKPSARERWNAHRSILDRLGGVSLQLSPGQHDMLHVIAGVQYAPMEQRATPGLLWSTLAGPGISRKPDIVLNHTNGTREVLVQDSTHTIHLIGGTGKVLWSRRLDGPILGTVTQVDRFKNGKLQLMLGTATTLYQIDRNGKDVDGFPLKLPATASAPLAVFDYDGTRDYRLLMPLTDGSLRNYGIDGAPVTGWENPRMEGGASTPVHHLRIRNKDHLLVVDANGRLKLLDRRGAERGKSTLELGPRPTLHQVVPGLDLESTRLFWTDNAGTVHEGRLDGTHGIVHAALPGTAWPMDLDRDGIMEVVRIHGDSIVVSGQGRTRFVRSWGTPLLNEVATYTLAGTWIGVVRPGTAQVTLLDDVGRDMPGMPLEGRVPMSIADLNLDGRFEVVTVARDGKVVAYRLP